jgi:hypothetical protein
LKASPIFSQTKRVIEMNSFLALEKKGLLKKLAAKRGMSP